MYSDWCEESLFQMLPISRYARITLKNNQHLTWNWKNTAIWLTPDAARPHIMCLNTKVKYVPYKNVYIETIFCCCVLYVNNQVHFFLYFYLKLSNINVMSQMKELSILTLYLQNLLQARLDDHFCSASCKSLC